MRRLWLVLKLRRLPTPRRPLALAVAEALEHANAGLRDLLAVADFEAAMAHGDFGDALSHLMDAGDRLTDLAGELRRAEAA